MRFAELAEEPDEPLSQLMRMQGRRMEEGSTAVYPMAPPSSPLSPLSPTSPPPTPPSLLMSSEPQHDDIRVATADDLLAAVGNHTQSGSPLDVSVPEEARLMLRGRRIDVNGFNMTIRGEGSGAVIDERPSATPAPLRATSKARIEVSN